MFAGFTTEDKLDCIFSMEESDSLSVDDWNMVKILSEDSDSEVRYRVAELLASFPSNESEEVLVAMLNDPDHLVRVSAGDSLSFSHSADTLKILSRLAKDGRYLVRGYAILSIGDIQKNMGTDSMGIISLLKSLDAKESSEWVRIAISRSLYVLGDYSSEKFLFEKINSRHYKNRCFVLSLFDQLLSDNMLKDPHELLPALIQRLRVEKALSVKLKLQALIEKISDTID